MVGERRFELPTSWSRTLQERKHNILIFEANLKKKVELMI